MNDDKFNEIRDVKWESITPKEGNINFRKNKIRNRIKKVFNSIIFVVIAAISGGVAATYITNKNVKNINTGYSGKNIVSQDTTREIPKNAITKVAEAVGPAVVGISNKGETFWGDITTSSGSGIIFKSDGYIVTNYHVIAGASTVTVKLASGQVLPAKLIGDDKRSDLAVIKINANNLPTAKFGDSSKIRVGDLAIAIGNPLGEEFAGSVTSGIISAVNRTMEYKGAVYRVLQTDAAINPGNSGGALCNENGEVIGINSLKLGPEVNAEGMGFAISIHEAKNIIDSLMNYGKVKRPVLGVRGQTVLSKDGKVKGFYVNEIVEGSAAAKSGIRPTDVITEIDGVSVQKFEDLAIVIDKHKIGDTISCKIWRNGIVRKISITLLELKDINY